MYFTVLDDERIIHNAIISDMVLKVFRRITPKHKPSYELYHSAGIWGFGSLNPHPSPYTVSIIRFSLEICGMV